MPRNFAASAATARFAAAGALLAALCQPVAAATCSASGWPRAGDRDRTLYLRKAAAAARPPTAGFRDSCAFAGGTAGGRTGLSRRLLGTSSAGATASPRLRFRPAAGAGRNNHGRFVYTPQTLVDGRDSNRWRGPTAPADSLAGTASDAGARLKLDPGKR